MRYPSIKNVCVIGSGTIGCGIAAHLANLGFSVALLDISQEVVVTNFDRFKVIKPPHFYVTDKASNIRLGNINDHLAWVSSADWVVEAVAEHLESKLELLAKLEPLLRPGTLVTTTTSCFSIKSLGASLSQSMREHFAGVHFLNAPRYVKLVELIPNEVMHPSVIHQITTFLEERVARRVVVAKDSPGFIASRFSVWSKLKAIHVAEELDLSIEEVDAITGQFLGRPHSGTFGLCDSVGLDLLRDLAMSVRANCPSEGASLTLDLPRSLHYLLDKGWLGEKTGQGYYRPEAKDALVLDLRTQTYRAQIEPNFPNLFELSRLPLGERIRKGVADKGTLGKFLRNYLLPTLRYAFSIREEVCLSVLDFDNVLKWGYGWEKGPFEIIDELGTEVVEIVAKPFYEGDAYRAYSGTCVPIPKNVEFKSTVDFPVVAEGKTFKLRDLGDGVRAYCLTNKMGIIDPNVAQELNEQMDKGLDRFVLTSEAKVFSVGFDLRLFLQMAVEKEFDAMLGILDSIQLLGERLEQKQCVSAVYGYCLGGGYELAISAPKMVLAAECQIGLPEAKVGLMPAGRGTTLTRLMAQANSKRLAEVAVHLAAGLIAPNADMGRVLGYVRQTDVTEYNPDRLLYTAKQLVGTVEPKQRTAWQPSVGPVGGMIDRALDEAKGAGELTEYDQTIGHAIKAVYAKATSYEHALRLEREEFIELCKKPHSLARLKHMVDTNKPIRN